VLARIRRPDHDVAMHAGRRGDDDAVEVVAAEEGVEILGEQNTELVDTSLPERQVVIPDRDEFGTGMLQGLPRVITRMNMPEPQDRDLERFRHLLLLTRSLRHPTVYHRRSPPVPCQGQPQSALDTGAAPQLLAAPGVSG